MKVNDVVQVKRYQGAVVWLFATVLDPATNLVQIQHPGNMENGLQFAAAAGDIRTKADVQILAGLVQITLRGAPGRQLTIAQIQTLAAADPALAIYLDDQHAKARLLLHSILPDHYANQISRLVSR